MNTNPNQNQTEYSPWNPFIPTARDIARTEELAQKNPVVAGVLTFILSFAGMIYLNRGLNNLKILGYVFVVAFMVGFVSYDGKNDREIDRLGRFVGICGQVALVSENIRAITLARQRIAGQ